ncbi:MAG TPA: hypothetical protein PK239_02410 [Chitinophagales bacterium]|nr:hypothetical protein [Chitinophagales bacterium]HRK26121.1 hypothetical protein [Chitinophagales bacterium]
MPVTRSINTQGVQPYLARYVFLSGYSVYLCPLFVLITHTQFVIYAGYFRAG